MASPGSAWEFVSSAGVLSSASARLHGFPAAGFLSCSAHVHALIAELWAPAASPGWGTSGGLV